MPLSGRRQETLSTEGHAEAALEVWLRRQDTGRQAGGKRDTGSPSQMSTGRGKGVL